MIILSIVRWVKHVARIGGLQNACEVMVHLFVEDRGPNKKILVWAMTIQCKEALSEPSIYFPISYLIVRSWLSYLSFEEIL